MVAAAFARMNRAEQIALARCFQDRRLFMETLLTIRKKGGGGRIPFKLNVAQQELYRGFKEEMKTRGFIRALVPKARRMGVSTFISGYYISDIAVSDVERRAAVLAHTGQSAGVLFTEARNMVATLPRLVRPPTKLSSAREMSFMHNGSTYKLSSSEAKEPFRSDEVHMAHLSEAAFFDAFEELLAAIMATLANTDEGIINSAMVFESTGNGREGGYYNMCAEAYEERNNPYSTWKLYFLPWWMDPNNRLTPPDPNWQPPHDFAELQKQYNLSIPQIYYLYSANHTLALKNGQNRDRIYWLTLQEHPLRWEDVFQAADSSARLFDAMHCERAQRLWAELKGYVNKFGQLPEGANTRGPNLLCVDPAGGLVGRDSTFVCDRLGPHIGLRAWGAVPKSFTTEEQAEWVANAFLTGGYDFVVIDATGDGRTFSDWVQAKIIRRGGSAEAVIKKVFSMSAEDEDIALNTRGELHIKLARFLARMDTSIPAEEALTKQLGVYVHGPGGVSVDEAGRVRLPLKSAIKKKLGGFSPDQLDCACLTTALD